MARIRAVEETLNSGHADTQLYEKRDSQARKSFAASPEEGRRLIQVFVRIQSAELRESIISLMINIAQHG
jgi:hypothetical protein